MNMFISYGLIIIGTLITVGAQAFVSSAYSKYSKVDNKKNLTGRDVARKILDKNGLSNVDVVEVDGYLSDHYDPTKKVVRLSNSIYGDTTIAAVSVAAHECGHAVQDKVGYKPMRIRSAIVPVVNIASYVGYFAIVIGLGASMMKLFWVGIIAELVIVAFQLVTLPVEINASRRALKEIEAEGFLSSGEIDGSKTMLRAAASTYVASVATALLQVLRLVLLFARNRD